MYISSNLYEDMARHGMIVTIYTPMPTRGIDSATAMNYRGTAIEHRCEGNLVIHRFRFMAEGKNSVLRAVRYLLLNVVLFWKGLFTKTDVIFVQSTPPTQGALGGMLKLMKGVPLVYNVQDLFPESLVTTGLAKQGSLLWRIGEAIMQVTYRNADRIVAISDAFKRNLVSKDVPREKVVVIPNWVDGLVVCPVDRKDNRLIERFGLEPNKFYITHCGNIGLTQNMDMLVDVAGSLQEHSDIEFLLIGDGAYKERVQDMIAHRGLRNLRVIPFQPYEDIAHVFSLGDVGLVISKAGVGGSSVPSKTWSIMAAERAVLASFDLDSELASVINNQRCGICVPSNDPVALREAILVMYRDRAGLRAMADNGRKYVTENLTRAIGTKKYIDTVESIVAQQCGANRHLEGKEECS